MSEQMKRIIGLSDNGAGLLVIREDQDLDEGYPASLVNWMNRIESRLSALEHPTEQGKGKWIRSKKVWRAYFNPSAKFWTVEVTPLCLVEEGEYWQPYDPEHPEPPSHPEVK
jgi:hypothetical protein